MKHASAKSFDVVCLGHALVDVQARVPGSFLDVYGLPKNAQRLIDAAQAAWLYNVMPPGIECSGGSGANSMVIVAALGGRAGFMGRIGADALGDSFARDLHAQGVAYAPRVRRAADGGTGRSLIFVTPDGGRSMNTALGCTGATGVEDVDAEMIRAARLLLVEGYMYDSAANRAATEHAIEIARSAGTRVAFTLSAEGCIARNHARFAEAVRARQFDIVVGNEDEFQTFYQTGSLDVVRTSLKREVPLAVMTRGGAGAEIIKGARLTAVPAVAGVHVVDTTGAGDAFAGGFLYALARGRSIKQSGQVAALCAAEVISHLGARPAGDLRAAVAPVLARQTTMSVRAGCHKPA